MSTDSEEVDETVVKEESAEEEIQNMSTVAVRSEPPSFISSRTNKPIPYDEYRLELEAWTLSTDIDKKKLGVIAARSLPEMVDGIRLRSRVLRDISLAELNQDDGMKKLYDWLDLKFKKDEDTEGFKCFKEWMSLERDFSKHKTIEEFIEHYDIAVCNAECKGVNKFEIIKAYRLLEASKLTNVEKQLVFSGIDFQNKENLYDQVRKALIKFKGENAEMINGKGDSSVLLDEVFLNRHEDVLASYGYWKQSKRFNEGGLKNGRDGQRYKNVSPKKNPKGPNGKPWTCHYCGSEYHFIAHCDKRREAQATYGKEDKKKEFSWVAECEESGMEEAHVSDISLASMCENIEGKGVIDCACSSSVAGRNWVDTFIKGLSFEDRNRVIDEESNKTFKFGGDEVRESLKCVTLPVVVAGVKGTIKTDVVEADIPLLLGMPVLKKAKIVINFATDEAVIFGKKVILEKLSIGHYVLPLTADYEKKFDICLKTCQIDSNMESERHFALKKLHEQMGHPGKDRLRTLIKNAGKWNTYINKELDRIYDNCETCKLFAKTPARSVVAMPRASNFNDILTLDIKYREDKMVLYMIDHFSRLTKGVFIRNKTPAEIVKTVMIYWVAGGFGMPACIHSDVGGEFSNAEVVEMAEKLGCTVTTTAGKSPYMNGLNEKNHYTVDRMYSMIHEDNPELKSDEILAHALHAKNALQMVHGYSSYQLVFGHSPNIPGIMGITPPMLSDVKGDMMRKHLNALYSARRAYVRCESDAKIRLALKSNLRNFSPDLQVGEWIYFKRDDERWKGPAKIIGREGKKLVVSQGGLISRVAAGMSVRVGEEFLHSTEGISDAHDEEEYVPGVKDVTEGILDDGGFNGNEQNELCCGEVVERHRIQRDDSPSVEIESTIVDEGEGDADDTTSETKGRVVLRKNDKVAYKVTNNDQWQEAVVLSRGGKASGKYSNYFNVQLQDSNAVKCVNFEELEEWKKVDSFSSVEQVNVVVVPKQMHGVSEVVMAKIKQLDDWKNFDVYEEVEDVGQERITGTWVVVKKEVAGSSGIKARWVARGFQEAVELRVDSPTISKIGIRILFLIAAAKRWSLEAIDVKSAFLQGDHLDRELYMEPPPEEKKSNIIWRLKKPVYGLNDASLKWYERFDKELISLNCVRSKFDNACYVFRVGGNLSGMACIFVDDVIGAGDQVFKQKIMGGLKNAFLIGKVEYGAFRYVGMNIQQINDSIIIDQEHYIDGVELIDMSKFEGMNNDVILDKEDQALYRSKVGALNWLSIQTRPDIAYDVMELSINFGKAVLKHLKEVNKCIKMVKNEKLKMIYPGLKDVNSWKIVSFGDGAHANLPDKVSSGGGHIVFIVDKYGSCCPIVWASNKIQRIVRSTLAAETMCMQDAIESSMLVKAMLCDILSVEPVDGLLIEHITDNVSLKNAIYSNTQVKDKRLRIDLALLKQEIEEGNIVVNWVPGKKMLADVLSKRGVKKRLLIDVVNSGKLSIVIEEMV